MASKVSPNSLVMSVSEAGACQKKFEFTVSVEAMKKEVEKTAKEFSGMVALPGFRRGKTPSAMLLRRYPEEIREEVMRKLVSGAFDVLSADKDLDIVSCTMAEEPAKLEFDAEYKFALLADLMPEFEVGEYKGLAVDAPLNTVEDSAVEERVDYYRTMYGSYADVTGPAQAEDMLKVSYSSDFVLPEEASDALKRQVASEENWLWLNEPEFLPGSIAALTGAEVEKEYTFASTYPAEWRDAELAGKTINYTVKVNGIQRRQALSDEELCTKLTVASMDEFRNNLRSMMENEAKQQQQMRAQELIYEKLDQQAGEFPIPAGVLANETEKMLRVMAQEQVKSEEAAAKFKEEMDAHRQEAEKKAADKLRRTFICRKIAKSENIAVSQMEMARQISEMSRYYGYKEKDFVDMLQRSGGMEELQLDMLNGKVMAFLVENAKLSAE